MKSVVEKALRPPPEMEEVEVSGFICPDCGGMGIAYVSCECACDAVPFTGGKYTRPKPQPVERTVSVEARLNPQGGAVVEALVDAAFRSR